MAIDPKTGKVFSTRPSGLFELAAAEGPYERNLICRSLGRATIFIRSVKGKRQKRLYIVPNGRLHRLDGEAIGWYTGVFRANLTDDFYTFPSIPKPPFDKPSHIDDIRPRMHPTKAVWEFPDGKIYGVGPANSYVIPLAGGSAQLVISIAMVLTGGTRRYKGARGTISSLGATWFPFIPGGSLQASLKTGAVFEAKGVHGFRITLADYQVAKDAKPDLDSDIWHERHAADLPAELEEKRPKAKEEEEEEGEEEEAEEEEGEEEEEEGAGEEEEEEEEEEEYEA